MKILLIYIILIIWIICAYISDKNKKEKRDKEKIEKDNDEILINLSKIFSGIYKHAIELDNGKLEYKLVINELLCKYLTDGKIKINLHYAYNINNQKNGIILKFKHAKYSYPQLYEDIVFQEHTRIRMDIGYEINNTFTINDNDELVSNERYYIDNFGWAYKNSDAAKYTSISKIKDKVPIWKKQYIYDYISIFPNNSIRKYYYYFKNEFLKGNYISLTEENSNYIFNLMFDFLENYSIPELKNNLLLLQKQYPVVSNYVNIELEKRNLRTEFYNNKEYYAKQHVYYSMNIDEPTQIIDWLNNYQHIKFKGDSNTNLICIINDDLTIDIKKLNKNDKNNYEVEIRIFKNQLPEFIQFNEVDCNFRVNNFGWDSSIPEYGPENREILPHIISTLIGCPKIVYGDFICEKLGLTTFSGCPKKIYGNLNIKSNKLSSFSGMPDYIQGCLNISNNDFTDESWEYVILHKDDEFLQTDFNTWDFSNNRFIKYDKIDLKQTLL